MVKNGGLVKAERGPKKEQVKATFFLFYGMFKHLRAVKVRNRGNSERKVTSTL